MNRAHIGIFAYCDIIKVEILHKLKGCKSIRHEAGKNIDIVFNLKEYTSFTK